MSRPLPLPCVYFFSNAQCWTPPQVVSSIQMEPVQLPLQRNTVAPLRIGSAASQSMNVPAAPPQLPQLFMLSDLSTIVLESMLIDLTSHARLRSLPSDPSEPAQVPLCTQFELQAWLPALGHIVQRTSINPTASFSYGCQLSAALQCILPEPSVRHLPLKMQSPIMPQPVACTNLLAPAFTQQHAVPTVSLKPFTAVCNGNTWLDLLADDFILRDGPEPLPPVAMPEILMQPPALMPAPYKFRLHAISHLELHLPRSFICHGPSHASLQQSIKQLQVWLRPCVLPAIPAATISIADGLVRFLPSNAELFPCKQLTMHKAAELVLPSTRPRALAK